jgi:hypothetical protein
MTQSLLGRIHLQVEDRHGTLYVSSKDLPGLFLWGNDPEDVLAKVKPTIRQLFRLNEHVDVSVIEAPTSKEARWSGLDVMANVFEVYRADSGAKNSKNG